MIEDISRRVSSLVLFVREVIDNPGAMGAICPSFPALTQQIAAQIPVEGEGLILELGGGTGTVTAALLKKGIAPERLVVIERSEKLARHLARRFPSIRIIQGDAAHLAELLGEETHKVSAIVSSLPLRSLPEGTVKAIALQLEQVLVPGTLFVQYTYRHQAPSISLTRQWINVYSDIIWTNLPPARLDVFQCQV